MRKEPTELFDPLLERREVLAGFIFFPIHFFLVPLAAGLLALRVPALTEGWANLIYYGIAVIFLASFMMPYLRRHFDALCARPARALLGLVNGFLIFMALNYLLLWLFSRWGWTENANPNNEAIFSLLGRDARIVKGLAIFVAPVVEEVLFRGILFGAVRRRSRLAAYALSVILFSVCHVWQYAALTTDWTLWMYALQYIPPAVALCLCFEKSGTLWSSIAFHMGYNALAYSLLERL